MDNGAIWWRRQGEKLAADAGQWDFHARITSSGALALWERYIAAADAFRAGKRDQNNDLFLLGPALFLMAVGTELLLKAIAVRLRPDLASTATKPFYSHDLRAIATTLTPVKLS